MIFVQQKPALTAHFFAERNSQVSFSDPGPRLRDKGRGYEVSRHSVDVLRQVVPDPLTAIRDLLSDHGLGFPPDCDPKLHHASMRGLTD